MRKSTVETTVVAQAVFIPIDNSPCKEWARDKFPPDKGGQGGCLPVWRREKPWTGFLCFCHSRHPSVIPAKAGIHLRMARRVSGTQTDGWMPGWIPVCTGMTERSPPGRGEIGKLKERGHSCPLPLVLPRKNGDQQERAGAQRSLPECCGGQCHGYHRGTGMSPLRYNYQLHCHCN